jgi:hypothetical protein
LTTSFILNKLKLQVNGEQSHCVSVVQRIGKPACDPTYAKIFDYEVEQTPADIIRLVPKRGKNRPRSDHVKNAKESCHSAQYIQALDNRLWPHHAIIDTYKQQGADEREQHDIPATQYCRAYEDTRNQGAIQMKRKIQRIKYSACKYLLAKAYGRPKKHRQRTGR